MVKDRETRKRSFLEDAELESDVQAFLQASNQNKLRDYINRGRSHEAKADADLIEAWNLAFEHMSLDVTSAALRQTEQDLCAELDLRQIAVPYEAVSVAYERFIAETGATIEELKADPMISNELTANWQRTLARS